MTVILFSFHWAAQYSTAERWRSVQACRCPLHSLTLRPATAPHPALTLTPLPISTFSLFIYCVEDLKPQIDLWDWFGNTLLPPPSFPSPPLPFPPLRLSLKRLLINPATSSVSCGEKKKKKKRVKWKDGGREGEGEWWGKRGKQNRDGRPLLSRRKSYVIHLITEALFDWGSKLFLERGNKYRYREGERKRGTEERKRKTMKRGWQVGNNWPFAKPVIAAMPVELSILA